MSQLDTLDGSRQIVRVDEDGRDLVSMPAQVGLQKVQTQYTTAVQVQQPRRLPDIERRSIEEATVLGSDSYYSWGQGENRVEGPSKDLAMTLVRCYGNCAVDLGEVQETPDAWIFTAKFIDLETGFTLARQFRQSKRWTVYGKFDEARKEDIRFQIGQSKAVRNVILNALPAWLVRRALDAAKGGVREKLEAAIKTHGAEKVIAAALASLEKLGVPEPRVLVTMGRHARQALTLEDLVILKGNISALEAGSDTVDNMFPLERAEGTAPTPGSSRTDEVLGKLGGASKDVLANPAGDTDARREDLKRHGLPDPLANASPNKPDDGPDAADLQKRLDANAPAPDSLLPGANEPSKARGSRR